MKIRSFIFYRSNIVRDMTTGSVSRALIRFSLPLMLGNVFQLLYNTVDAAVVGHFIGKEALAAVSSTTAITNMMVLFFSGFSVGVGVVISQNFGSGDMYKLHSSIETTMAVTFIICLLFTAAGVSGIRPVLTLMATPEDVFDEAFCYLRIYFAGISGLLIYNIGSGILRAVGNTMIPLFFLIFSSLLNIVLDLLLVPVLHTGIAGAALATIISQFVSAFLILLYLSVSKEVCRFVWTDLHIDLPILRKVFSIGLPEGIESVITAFSNVFVQSYINRFGSACMAGWGCYNKVNQFVLLPTRSISMAATTFVSQNYGAGKQDRAKKGIFLSTCMTLGITTIIALLLFILSSPAVHLFTSDHDVISYGARFLKVNIFFLLAHCINHVLSGSLRGMGDAKGPMIIMLFSFVFVRQLYLFLITHLSTAVPEVTGFCYPVGWVTCCIIELIYYLRKNKMLVNCS